MCRFADYLGVCNTYLDLMRTSVFRWKPASKDGRVTMTCALKK
jgi:hypothetical protein